VFPIDLCLTSGVFWELDDPMTADSVRPDKVEAISTCVMGTAAACQRVIGSLLMVAVPTDPSEFSEEFLVVPRPTSYADAAMAAVVLLRFLQNLGTVIHRRLHAPGDACLFDPLACMPPIQVDSTNPSRWHPAYVFRQWTQRFVPALRVHHDLVTARIRAEIMRNPANGSPLATLAREAGISVSVMRRRFVAATGETYLQYRTRLRVILVIALLRQNWKPAAAAKAAGWKSPKDMYRALVDVAAVSPATVRTMPDDVLNALVVKIAACASAADLGEHSGT